MFRWVLVSITTGEVVAGFNNIAMLQSAWKSFTFEQRLGLRCHDTQHFDGMADDGYVEV